MIDISLMDVLSRTTGATYEIEEEGDDNKCNKACKEMFGSCIVMHTDDSQYSISMIVEPDSGYLYLLTAYDLDAKVEYCYTSEEYREKYYKIVHGFGDDFDPNNVDLGVEHSSVVYLETREDALRKMEAIYRGEDYDKRVDVPLDIDDDLLLQAFKMAHEKDMTFNEFMVELLTGVMEKEKGEGN